MDNESAVIQNEYAWAQHLTSNECGGELARAYIPFQRMHDLYAPEESLLKGTIFPELYQPYHDRENEKRCHCKKHHDMPGREYKKSWDNKVLFEL